MEFTCGYCGKVYSTIGERMECEKGCHEEKIREEEKLKAAKRDEEISKDYSSLMALVKERDELDQKISDSVKKYNQKYYGTEISSLNQLFPDHMHWFYF